MPELSIDIPERLRYVPPCPFKPRPGLAIAIPDVAEASDGGIHIPRATWQEAKGMMTGQGGNEELRSQLPYLPHEDWVLVIAVGDPGTNYDSGVEVPWSGLKPGDRARLSRVVAIEIEGNQGYLFFDPTDVLCTESKP